jgi:UDP-N-acetylglucosamine--N-acetylmuramyl-(pentapeptide) pyrophosphoryl-undecaprenol N-acetylglucosamine transferase
MAPPPAAPRVLLAGGGTGGHVFPALAVGEELARRGWRVSYAGLAQGLEARLVAARGGDFHPLAARPVLGRGPWDRLRSLATLGRSTLAARRLVRRLGARAVVGTGGYASAPAVLGARLARRPALLLEPNARAGTANRFLSRFAAEAAVAFAGTAAQLACPAAVTGVPVREAFFRVPELAAQGAPRLLVLGGSQGARQLNELVPAAVAALGAAGGGLTVLHQCGEAHLAAAAAAYAAAGLGPERAAVVAFIDDVAGALAGCRLVISRAGALTVAELCAAGRPAICVPLAAAAGHQRDNARILAEAGAAILLAGEEATPGSLAAHLEHLLGDPDRLTAMGRAARGLAHPGAVAAIADRVEALANAHAGGGASP